MNYKQSFLSALIFSFTFVAFLVTYGAWVNLTTQNDGDRINATIWNNLVNNVNSLSGSIMPSGAIMAFNLSSCPNGWTEFTAARGRFLRGLDNGSGNDPDCAVRTGGCVIGSVQSDEFKSHSHVYSSTNNGTLFDNPNNLISSPRYGVVGDKSSSYTGGNETRPKNVAVLYCVKN